MDEIENVCECCLHEIQLAQDLASINAYLESNKVLITAQLILLALLFLTLFFDKSFKMRGKNI